MASLEKLLSSTATERIFSITKHLKDFSMPGSVQQQPQMTGYKFRGWLGLDKDAVNGKMVWQDFEPKTWTESDIDIKVTHCGICASDLHTLRSGWGPTIYPCCVGHEVVGAAVRVGSQVKHIKLGDRCGVGAQSSSCLQSDCEECSNGQEQYCSRTNVGTYNGKYSDGSKSYGGYAEYCRAPGHFFVKIPDGLTSSEAAPMLCGGVTTYTPLINNGAGPGMTVGIVGVGGLGHFGIMWAKALGCDKVVAISRSSSKEADIKKMGADYIIATGEDPKWGKKHSRTLDLILCTISDPQMPLKQYIQLLRTNGTFIQVGAPEGPIPNFNVLSLVNKGAKIGGSSIGSPGDLVEMLQFAVDKNIHPWIIERPMKEANQALLDMEANKARYRYVLVNGESLNSD